MSRFTEARMRRWAQQIDKHTSLLESLQMDISAARLQAKGGRLSNLTALLASVKHARMEGVTIMTDFLALQASEERKRVGASL